MPIPFRVHPNFSDQIASAKRALDENYGETPPAPFLGWHSRGYLPHFDAPYVHCEGGHEPSELVRLEELGYEVVRWRRRNLFFGGAAAVETLSDGSLAAAGDPRRGGASVVVEA